MAKGISNVHLTHGVGANHLQELFKSSSLFAMPSLVEGFGQVYLEALAHGYPVLGTPNTGLPDLCGDNDVIWQVEPGQIDQLVSALESLSHRLPGVSSIRPASASLCCQVVLETFSRRYPLRVVS
jgi:glycosyltransferase involved in cell wall biosynthesis